MLRLPRLAAAAAVTAALALTVGAQTLKAQTPVQSPTTDPLDPVKVDPENYKVVYEDDEVRVIRYQDKPGYKGPIHDHRHPYVVYVRSPATRQFNTLDKQGGCTVKAKVLKLTRHQTLTPAVPVTHCELNIGKTDTHLIIVEHKVPPPAPPTPRRAANRSTRRLRR